MSSKLQLTTLAVLVSAALPAQAALYKVVEVTPGVSGSEYYGTAIQPSGSDASCFTTDCGDGIAYALGGETRNRPEGFSYREEVAFALDNSFDYIDDNNDDGFENYCYAELGYSTCESWASTQYWNGWNIEKTSNSQNSIAFVTDGGAIPSVSGAINTVVNALTENRVAVGNSSTSTKRNIAFSEKTFPANQTEPQSRAWFNDGEYTVGSVSTLNGVSSRYYYKSQAAVWDGDTLFKIPYASGSNIGDTDNYIQSSLRGFYIDSTDTFYGVGYNSYTSDNDMNATIFSGSKTDLANLTSTAVSRVEVGDDNVYANSVVTNINKNLVAVGQAKYSRYNDYADQGARPNKLFVISNVKSPSADFLSDRSDAKSVFFNSGAGGQMGGINNFNEIVGRVDSESHREDDGKIRRQRAFIYPYGVTANISDQATKDAINARRAIIGSEAQLIDNLTNGGAVSNANNHYRIYDASDINDAGVISATAIMCEGGYDSTAHDAYCGNGKKKEKVVAVKLVPIVGAVFNSDDKRGYENRTIERQGGSLGFGAMTLLGLFGFMRKRIK